jgi:hypothetical protein
MKTPLVWLGISGLKTQFSAGHFFQVNYASKNPTNDISPAKIHELKTPINNQTYPPDQPRLG